MDKKKTDIRIIKTRRAIKSAFLTLLEKEGFSRITVRDIIREAEINRSTFYAHYMDKYDLLDQIEQDLLEQFSKVEVDVNHFSAENTDEHLKNLMENRAGLLKEQGRLIAQIVSKEGDPAFIEKLGISIGNMWSQAHLADMVTVPDNYIKAAVLSTMSGLLGEWIRGGFKESPEEFASLAVTIMSAFPKTFLNGREQV